MEGPKTLMEFMEMYKTEEDCRQALFEHRWPDGFRCRRCGHDRAYAHKKRPLFECACCGHQASVTAGTIFEGTRTDLKKWFLAIYLLAQTKKPISSAELGRHLGVAPFTAWSMKRKIMHAMARREGELMLAGVVEMDESYVGGASKGRRGRGAEAKTPVAATSKILRSCSPGCTSSSPTSNAGYSMPFMVSAPSIYSPIWMSSVTGSTGGLSAPIFFAGCSTAASVLLSPSHMLY